MFHACKCLAFLGMAIAFLACSRASTETDAGGGRREAPAFSLLDSHGTTYRLDQYRGKVVLLNFWAPWCFNCAGELTAFQELKSYLSSDEFEVLTVAEVPQNEAGSVKYNFPVLFDADRSVADKYQVAMLPVTFVIDKAGRIVSFPDPDHEENATVFQGPRGWNSLKVVRNLQMLFAE